MLKKRYILVFLTLVLVHSCKTDFNVIAPYKEITVVYGLLDPAASVQYIKINKAFLGEGNALVMARQSDSINYQPGQLDVKLQRVFNGQVIETTQLDTTTIFPKDSGLFSYPYQILYKGSPSFPQTSDVQATKYNLVIYDRRDQKTLSSSTPVVSIIGDNSIINPAPGERVNFTNSNAPTYEVRFEASVNARLYSLLIRFHYNETNTSTHVTVSKTLDWDQGTEKSIHLDGNEQIVFEFNRSTFYTFLKSRIPVDLAVTRSLPATPVEFIITYAGDDLSTYIDVNQPSIGIIQEKPQFSNIANGIGIFSSRSARSLPRDLDLASVDSLQTGQVTKDLNFQ